MKKMLPVTLFLLTLFQVSRAETFTVSSSGFDYTPATLTIQVGDQVNFNIGPSHDAVEVSRATWDANGATPNGGFVLGFGGGILTFNTPGIYYYVCTPHASLGMKGVIIVESPTSINQPGDRSLAGWQLFPNPAGEWVSLHFSVPERISLSVDLIDLSGKLLKQFNTQDYPAGDHVVRMNLDAVAPGRYLVRVNTGNSLRSIPLIKAE